MKNVLSVTKGCLGRHWERLFKDKVAHKHTEWNPLQGCVAEALDGTCQERGSVFQHCLHERTGSLNLSASAEIQRSALLSCSWINVIKVKRKKMFPQHQQKVWMGWSQEKAPLTILQPSMCCLLLGKDLEGKKASSYCKDDLFSYRYWHKFHFVLG